MEEAGPSARVDRRLMIREMVLENFKSYAGQQRVGPFHKSFSSVVGPNGSGKSNVIDAMLFVFGRRAKQLRFNKVSELIHNSTNFRNLETARVTVYFQEILDKEGEEFEVVPGTEFSVARTAHRNNQSDYYINDRKVSAKEVTDRLKAKGIDLDNNRFLILQGEVEQIAMMKPKGEDKNDTGLLEYLEDIIGTDKYVQPIEESAKRLEEVNDKRQGMLQRLKLAEKEKDQLEGKSKEAELFLEKQAEMTKASIMGLMKDIRHTQGNLEKYATSSAELEAKLQHERNKHTAYDKEFKAKEKKYKDAEKQLQAIMKSLETAQEEFKAFERKDAKAQMELKHLKQKLKKAAAKMEEDTANCAKLEAEISAIEQDVPRCKAQVEAMTAELARQEKALEDMMEEIKGEAEVYHQQLAKVRSDLAPWERKIGEVQSRMSVASAERDVLAKKSEDARRRLDAALKGLNAAQASAQAKQQQIKELETALKKCRQQLEQGKKDLAGHQQEEARLEGAVREASDKVAGLRAEIGSSQQQTGVAAALIAAQKKGEVQGVFGRLGDLGAIDPKYDIAVSTAIGALDYIVVETASDAQRCVEHLRKNNLGIATFLILEKQRHLDAPAREKLNTPEGAPRLFDLVRYKDERLRPAFFFAMQNTLVAENLEQASRIAYGGDRRFRRVVTLQGQLIAESGTMSGGGGRPMRGRMQLGSAAPRGSQSDAKALAEELKKAEKELEQLQVARRAASDQAAACERAVRGAEKQLGELETALPKARMEAEAEATKAADIQQRLDELRAATEVNADDATRIQELELQIAREELSLQGLRQQTQGLEVKATEIQRKIDGAGGDKLKKQKAAVAKLRKDIDDAEAEATRRAVQAKSHAKTVERVRKDVAKDAKEKEKMEAELAKHEADIKAMEDEALGVLQRKEEAQAQVDGKKAEVDAARAERDAFQQEFGIIRSTEATIEEHLESIKKRVKEETGMIAKWEAGVEKFRAKLRNITATEDEWMPDPEVIASRNAKDFHYTAGMLEQELGQMNPDMTAIEEYRAKLADYNARAKELEEVTTERDELRRTYESLRKNRLDEFMAGFNIISLRLKEMYQMITLGGDAELELVDSLDPFSEGIVFSVRPPKKSWKNISNLSGGEKTLSSLSLVFALHHFKPTPLYVMDEIDAALDFKNVSIVGHYIKERTRNAQFVIISLRNNMFELADRLVGIYKTDNTTKTVTINPGEFAVPGAAADKENKGKGRQAKAAGTQQQTQALAVA